MFLNFSLEEKYKMTLTNYTFIAVTSGYTHVKKKPMSLTSHNPSNYFYVKNHFHSFLRFDVKEGQTKNHTFRFNSMNMN